MVAHDGAQWLPRLLQSLSSSSRLPDLVVGVDTGSVDESGSLLALSPVVGAVCTMSRDTGFGVAVQAGLAVEAAVAVEAAPGISDAWIWLLHDDCVVAPDTLEGLLQVASAAPDVDVVGCRVRAWPSGRRLLEVGVTITGTGHRETGVELGEYDQGQHDEVRDVLAVSSAGMLVRRQVWESLGGFDPDLPLFRDDVDFGWRASAAGHRVVVAGGAAVFHAEAASRGVRATTCTPGSPHRADRRAALFTLLANCRPAALPFIYLRLLLGSLVRALGYLLGKLPAASWDELSAAAAVLGRPWRLYGARARRRRTRHPRVDVRRLLPPWWTPYANGLDAALSRFGSPARETASSVAASARRLRRRPRAASPLSSLTAESAAPRTVLARHPLLLVFALLSVASLLAARGLYGSGFLQGGALLPAPDGARDWWHLYGEVAHPVGLGSAQPAAPYVAMLALGATVLLGKAWLVVDVLMLLAAPLAGAGAWVASKAVVRGLGARLWMAIAYGLAPIITGAVSSGHLGTVVAALALPWVLRAGCAVLGCGTGGWRAAALVGLTLSVAAAFAPVAWLVLAAVGGVAVGWLALSGRPLRAAQLAAGVALPLVLLIPWSWRVLMHPGLALSEAGVTTVPGSVVDSWQLAAARAGGAEAAPSWVTAGLLVVALLSLLRRDTRSRVAGAWVLVVAGAVGCALLAGELVTPVGGGPVARSWLGVPLVVALAGVIAAAGVAADGLSTFVGSGSFGWRQPVAALGVSLATATVVLSAGWWVVTVPQGSLQRDVAVPVPAYMIAAMSDAGQRVLVLHTGGPVVRYSVLAGDGLRLGDDSVLPGTASAALPRLIAGLVSQSRPSQVNALGRLGVGYVVVPSPQRPSAVAQLDAAAGLTRTSSYRGALSGWQLDADLVRPAALPSGPDRGWVLAVQGLLWLCVIVLAAPAILRHPLPAVEEDA